MLPIRPAAAADVPAIAALINRAYRGDSARAGWTHEADYLTDPRIDPAEVAAIVADPAGAMLIADDGGTVAACIHVRDAGTGTAYLGLLAVEPTRQAGSLGRTMIAAAEDRARTRGATRVEMTVVDRRPELIAYYERRGYARTGEVRPFPPDQIETVPLSLLVLAKPL